MALAYGLLLEGAVLIETRLLLAGRPLSHWQPAAYDMNGAMGCVLLVGASFVMLNLLSDMLCINSSIRGQNHDGFWIRLCAAALAKSPALQRALVRAGWLYRQDGA